MANLIPDLKRYLAGEGYTGSLQDMWKQALAAESATSFKSVQDLEKAFLEAQGLTGSLPGMWREYLEGLGYTGAVQDMFRAAVAADGLFVAEEPLFHHEFINYSGSTLSLADAVPDVDSTTGAGWANPYSLTTQVAIWPIRNDAVEVRPPNKLFLDYVGSLKVDEAFTITDTAHPSYIFKWVPEMEDPAVSSIRHAVALRYQDKDNYMLVLSSEVASSSSSLYEVTGGTLTLRGSAVIPVTAGGFKWVADDGSTITVGRNTESAAITYTTTAHDTYFGTFGIPAGFSSSYEGSIKSVTLHGGSTDPSTIPSPSVDQRAVPKLVLNDTFTDVDGTRIDGHTPDFDLYGSGWSRSNQIPEILNNEVTLSSLNNTACHVPYAGAPCIIEATHSGSGNDRLALFVRGQSDNDSHFRVVLTPSTGDIRASRYNGGVELATPTPVTVSGSGPATSLWVADSGSEITFGVDRGPSLGTAPYALSDTSVLHHAGIHFNLAGDTVDSFKLYANTTDPSDLS